MRWRDWREAGAQSAIITVALTAISRELALLTQNGIETEGQLLAHEEALKERMAALDGERRALRNEARRLRRAQGEPAAPNPRIAEIAAELKGIRRDLGLCDGIRERGPGLARRIAEVERGGRDETERKETEHGRIERSR